MSLTAKQRKLPLTKAVRKKIIEELANDYVDSEMDDGAREPLYHYIVNGCKGLKDYTDEQLLAEWDEANSDE